MRPLSPGGSQKSSTRSARLAALALMLGLTIATSQGTAWAETGGAETRDGSVTQSDTAAPTGGVSSPSESLSATESISATENDATTDTLDTAAPSDVDDESVPPTDDDEATTPDDDPPSLETEPEETTPGQDWNTTSPVVAAPSVSTKAAHRNGALTVDADAGRSTAVGLLDAPAAPTAPTTEVSRTAKLLDPARSIQLDIAPSAKSLSTAAVGIAPVTPGPVSPIAEIVALPGRIVNAVLQLVGITTAAGNEPGPISPAPFADLFFAVFRRLEEAIGLTAPVSVPVPPSMTYTGPLDVNTPTVAQFLNAATTEYVLGGVAGGLVPLTVDGWPMMSTETGTGMTAQVWVTPQSQIIIAYSGTTGGTNLLFNPLIAISQIFTDAQAGFNNGTPKAFLQALAFAQQVQAEAAKQGYAPDSVFVTGHSLGAWEAQYVAQQLGLNGIGFEGPGLATTVPGNGADSLFVNTATYGDMASFLASDLPGLYPFAPAPYVPGGGLKPHYGPIVMLGDPAANNAMVNAAGLWGKGVIGSLIAVVDLLGNFFASHLPGVQAYNLDVVSDPSVVPWLGIKRGPVNTGFGELTIPEFLKAASDAGILVAP